MLDNKTTIKRIDPIVAAVNGIDWVLGWIQGCDDERDGIVDYGDWLGKRSPMYQKGYRQATA